MRDNPVILAPRKLRRDAYLNSLSGSDFDKARAILTASRFSLLRAWKALPLWGEGKFAGRRLSPQSVLTQRKRLRVEFIASKAEAACRAAVPRAHPSGRSSYESLLLEGIALAAERMIAKSIQTLDSKTRFAAVRLLLRRADQRRWQIKMNQ